MGEKIKFKDGERSQLALFCNAKEEILLNKKLKTLESLKKQAENALCLDQRILYKRFTIKLRRSELAHARLLGNKDLVKVLSRSLFPNLHSVVTDGSEKAVRVVLQNAETSRALSAPSRIQGNLAPASFAKKRICEGLQGKEAAMIKDVQKCPGRTEETKTQTGKQRRNTSGGKNALNSEKETGFRKSVLFLEHGRPHTTNYETHNRQSNMNDRYQERFVGKTSKQQVQVVPVKPFSPEGFVDDNFLKPKALSGRNQKSYKWRPKSRDLFLGLNNVLLERNSSMSNPTVLKNEGLLNNKVKLFLQKLTDLQHEQNCPLQDYYSERLQEKLGKKCYRVNQDCLLDTKQEESKWNPVGLETNHRSITIKKLDRNFIGKDSPFEIMTWDYYNEIVTKENLMERNWPNNNPYQLIKS